MPQLLTFLINSMIIMGLSVPVRHFGRIFILISKDDESIVDYGSRIEQTLTRAFRTTQIELSLKDAMLRTKFWTGLSKQILKNSTRHLFDTVKDFQHLLCEMRKVEQEQFSATVTPATG